MPGERGVGLKWSSWEEPSTSSGCVQLRALRADVRVRCRVTETELEDERVRGSTERRVRHALLMQLCDELMQRGEFDQ